MLSQIYVSGEPYVCNIDFTKPMPRGVTNLNDVPITAVHSQQGPSALDEPVFHEGPKRHITSGLDLNLI